MSSWIKLHRSMMDHWLYKEHRPMTRREAWETMLLLANYEPTKVMIHGTLYECGRGQSLLSIGSWADKFLWSIKQVRTFFNLLEKDGMITVEGLRHTTRLTICNYGLYQDKGRTEGTTEGEQREQQREQQRATIKEDKEIKEGEEFKEESLSPAIASTPSPKNYKKATMSEIIKTFDRVNKTSSDFEDFAGDYALTAIGFYELFDNNIKAAGGKATVLQKAKGTWIDDIRQICEKDGYNLNDLREAYTFLTHDLFWQKNILSAQTLRKQMDKLKMAMKSEKEKSERTAQKTGVKVGDPRFCTDWSKSEEEYHLGF